MKFKILFTLFIIISFVSFAQKTVQEDNSIKGQFDEIYRTSTTFKPLGTGKKYKVINLINYNDLKSNVLDSLKSSKHLISEKEDLLQSERENIQNINASLNKTKVKLEAAEIQSRVMQNQVETQLLPVAEETDRIAAIAKTLPADEFQQALAMAELSLKQQELDTKENIVKLQMGNKNG